MSDNNEKQRKTLDERDKMSELERIRHSTAHVLATAIAKIWPDAQFAYGPPLLEGVHGFTTTWISNTAFLPTTSNRSRRR